MKLHKARILLAVFLFAVSIARSQTTYDINPNNISHQVDVNVYGHFLEHIYNSANNGLWGDLVWNRSFEMVNTNEGEWTMEGEAIIQSSLNTDIRLLIGDIDWQDYELTLEAKKLGGAEGFLIMFRAGGGNFYWLNLGGWGNDQHGIEKANDENKTVIQATPGNIETGRWYNIKIRCVGSQFLAVMDGDTLFNVTDNNAHLKGQVGLGTWLTSASFRNIKVTEVPTGKVLFEGIPDLDEPAPASIPYWQPVNEASMYLSRDHLNSERSVLIQNVNATSVGIQQTNFHLQEQSYTGSFWAKSDVGTAFFLNLLTGSDTVGQRHFTSSTSDWEEYVFEFNPILSTTDGTLQILFTGADTAFIDQVSMIGEDSKKNEGFRPDLIEAVNGLQPPIIRWPGGCFSSAYFWKDGIGKQEERRTYPIKLWDDMDVNSLGTDEFMQLCELTGAEPLICFNSGILDITCGVPITKKLTPEEYLQDALDWMEYCNGDTTTTWGKVRAANGHPEPYNVKYWEIDNEVWVAGIDEYVEVVKRFAPVMREKYPDVKIIACGSGGYDQRWNQVLIDECADLIDYVSTHHYESNNNFATGVKDYENFIEDFADMVAASSNPDLKMYMSEWGVWGPIDWRAGLHTGGLLNVFERQGEVFTLGGPALFLRHENACCWNNAFINFNNSDWFPAPNYVVMKLWREHYAPNFINVEESNFDLNAVATLSADSTALFFKLINPTALTEEITLRVDTSFQLSEAKMRQVYSSSLFTANTMDTPDNIRVRSGLPEVFENNISFEVQPYSANVVALGVKKKQAEQEEVLDVDNHSRLFINFPNPFSNQLSIRFSTKGGSTSLVIYDNAGRLVKELADGEFASGEYSIIWNGDGLDGTRLENGIYLVELHTGNTKIVERVILEN